MVARQSIMKKWVSGAHGNTYGGNPLACTAALATLDLVKNGMMENAAEQGEFIMDALAEMQVRHPSIGDVRGKGLMIGVEFVQDKTTKQTRASTARGYCPSCVSKWFAACSAVDEAPFGIAPPLMIQKPLVEEALELLKMR